MGLLTLPKIREKATRFSFFDVWKRRYLGEAYKEMSLKGVTKNYNFYSDGYGTYSGKDDLVYYFTFDGLPSELPIAFVDEYRSVAKVGVKISFVSYIEPTVIDWDSPALQNKLKVWKKVSEEAEDVDEFTFRENVRMLDLDTLRRQSLVYLSSAEIRRKRRLFKYRTMMFISGKRGSNFDETVQDCMTVSKNLGISANRVTEDMGIFLKAFSPMAAEMSDKAKKLVGNTTLTDEVI